jgi:peroxiredoxin
MRVSATVILLAFMLSTPGWAQDAPKGSSRPSSPPRPTAGTTPAPRLPARIESQVVVGDRAPGFELDGSQGAPVRLSRWRGSWVLLLFEEDRVLAPRLREVEAAMRPLGVVPLTVCGEKARTLEALAVRDTLTPLVLADVTGEISALYGLFDYGRARIRPGLVLVDRVGVVRMALLGQSLPVAETRQLVERSLAGR